VGRGWESEGKKREREEVGAREGRGEKEEEGPAPQHFGLEPPLSIVTSSPAS